MERPAGFLVLSLLLLGAVLLAVPASALSGPAGGPALQEATPEPPAVDNTVTRIELGTDGSARWTVTIRTRLGTDAEAEEYAAFQERFRENTSRFLGPFERRIRAVVAGSADATGRSMAASEFTAETRIQEVPRRWGIVEYGFTWSGFAEIEGEAVVVGDAFAGGFFLARNDTLVIAPPPGHTIAAAEPAPTDRGDRAVAWTGRQDFADARPSVRAVPSSPGDGSTTSPPAGLSDLALVGAGLLGLALLAGLGAVAYRRRAGGAPAEAVGVTDEERVVELLDDRGGRLPQSAVAEAFGWSTSKTSRLLSRMAEEGRIEKLQLGRENLIRLPEAED